MVTVQPPIFPSRLLEEDYDGDVLGKDSGTTNWWLTFRGDDGILYESIPWIAISQDGLWKQLWLQTSLTRPVRPVRCAPRACTDGRLRVLAFRWLTRMERE